MKQFSKVNHLKFASLLACDFFFDFKESAISLDAHFLDDN